MADTPWWDIMGAYKKPAPSPTGPQSFKAKLASGQTLTATMEPLTPEQERAAYLYDRTPQTVASPAPMARPQMGAAQLAQPEAFPGADMMAGYAQRAIAAGEAAAPQRPTGGTISGYDYARGITDVLSKPLFGYNPDGIFDPQPAAESVGDFGTRVLPNSILKMAASLPTMAINLPAQIARTGFTVQDNAAQVRQLLAAADMANRAGNVEAARQLTQEADRLDRASTEAMVQAPMLGLGAKVGGAVGAGVAGLAGPTARLATEGPYAAGESLRDLALSDPAVPLSVGVAAAHGAPMVAQGAKAAGRAVRPYAEQAALAPLGVFMGAGGAGGTGPVKGRKPAPEVLPSKPTSEFPDGGKLLRGGTFEEPYPAAYSPGVVKAFQSWAASSGKTPTSAEVKAAYDQWRSKPDGTPVVFFREDENGYAVPETGRLARQTQMLGVGTTHERRVKVLVVDMDKGGRRSIHPLALQEVSEALPSKPPKSATSTTTPPSVATVNPAPASPSAPATTPPRVVEPKESARKPLDIESREPLSQWIVDNHQSFKAKAGNPHVADVSKALAEIASADRAYRVATSSQNTAAFAVKEAMQAKAMQARMDAIGQYMAARKRIEFWDSQNQGAVQSVPLSIGQAPVKSKAMPAWEAEQAAFEADMASAGGSAPRTNVANPATPRSPSARPAGTAPSGRPAQDMPPQASTAPKERPAPPVAAEAPPAPTKPAEAPAEPVVEAPAPKPRKPRAKKEKAEEAPQAEPPAPPAEPPAPPEPPAAKPTTADFSDDTPPSAPEAPKGPWYRAFGNAYMKYNNFSRSVMASGDFSGMLNQGGPLSAWRPALVAKAGKESLQAFQSKGKAAKVTEEIDAKQQRLYNDPDFYEKVGLSRTPYREIGGKPDPNAPKEEVFTSDAARKFPGVERTDRAYSVGLDRQRTDVFDSMFSRFKDSENAQSIAEDIARMVNVMGGRGDIARDSKLEAAVNNLANVFFSPRYQVSRMQYAVGQPLFKARTPEAKRAIATEYARYISAQAAYLTTMQASGLGTVETDPRSSDFLKVKSKLLPVTLDTIGAQRGYYVALARVLTGQSISSSGNTRQVGAGEVVGNLARGKLSPVPAAALNLMAGKDLGGNPTRDTAGQAVWTVAKTSLPLNVSALAEEIYKADGDSTKVAAAVAGYMSQTVGVNANPTRQPKGGGARFDLNSLTGGATRRQGNNEYEKVMNDLRRLSR